MGLYTDRAERGETILIHLPEAADEEEWIITKYSRMNLCRHNIVKTEQTKLYIYNKHTELKNFPENSLPLLVFKGM